jgi:hypothetical protein
MDRSFRLFAAVQMDSDKERIYPKDAPPGKAHTPSLRQQIPISPFCSSLSDPVGIGVEEKRGNYVAFIFVRWEALIWDTPLVSRTSEECPSRLVRCRQLSELRGRSLHGLQSPEIRPRGSFLTLSPVLKH